MSIFGDLKISLVPRVEENIMKTIKHEF